MPNAQRRGEFMRWTDNRLWLFDHVGRLTPSRCLALCRYFADELKGAHVFIDSMMKVCQSEELDQYDEMRSWTAGSLEASVRIPAAGKS